MQELGCEGCMWVGGVQTEYRWEGEESMPFREMLTDGSD